MWEYIDCCITEVKLRDVFKVFRLFGMIFINGYRTGIKFCELLDFSCFRLGKKVRGVLIFVGVVAW